jgi:hypothetical protein
MVYKLAQVKIIKHLLRNSKYYTEANNTSNRSIQKILLLYVPLQVFGPKRDKVTGEWRKLHKEELKDLYSLPNIVQVVKLRRMRWAGHVACMGRIEGCTGCWWGNLRERERWGDPDIDGRIILRWMFRKLEGVVGTGWSWLRIGTGTCEYGKELLGSIKMRGIS